MSRYDDILKRNEQLIDNVYEMNEEITELANENEYLTRENDVLYDDNMNLNEHNAELKKGIAELHKSSVKRGGKREYRVQPQYQQPQYQQPITQSQQPQSQPQLQQMEVEKVHRTAISVFMSEKAKNTSIFCILIFLILLLGLGIEPGVAMTYQSLLDCYLELVFNLYNLCILGTIGFLLRKIWKKINK